MPGKKEEAVCTHLPCWKQGKFTRLSRSALKLHDQDGGMQQVGLAHVSVCMCGSMCADLL